MRLVFDLDGTLCRSARLRYDDAKPIRPNIRRVNRLAAKGHVIIISTARGSMTGQDWTALTKEQLAKWGVKYHQLVMGKVAGDAYIDDLAYRPDEKWPGEE